MSRTQNQRRARHQNNKRFLMYSRRYPNSLCGTLLGAPCAKCTAHQHYSTEHLIPHNVLQSQYPTALFPHRTNMNYATPQAFDVGYSNRQNMAIQPRAEPWPHRLSCQNEKKCKSRGSVHERGVSCYIALQEIVMFMRLRGDPAASKIVMCFASTGIYVLPS